MNFWQFASQYPITMCLYFVGLASCIYYGGGALGTAIRAWRGQKEEVVEGSSDIELDKLEEEGR